MAGPAAPGIVQQEEVFRVMSDQNAPVISGGGQVIAVGASFCPEVTDMGDVVTSIPKPTSQRERDIFV
jgi:hypothetical protein